MTATDSSGAPLGTNVAIVGGSVIGLATALKAASAGFTVTVYDPSLSWANSAGWCAGGMLGGITEAWPGEDEQLRLGAASLRHWPGFGGKLNANHPHVFTSTVGTLNVGVDAGDVADLEKIYQYVTTREDLWARGGTIDGVAPFLAPGSDNPVDARMRKITRRELRALEPSLSRAARAALLTEGERSVDNRELLAALREQCEGTYGVTLCERQIDDLNDLVNGTIGRYDQVVLAAGNGSQALAATVGINLPIRPIKGEVLRLHSRPGVPEPPKRTIRGRVHGRPIYLVPRPWGLLIGATEYEHGEDRQVTVGGVLQLLEDTEILFPGVTDYELYECIAGLRPGSIDNLPYLGRVPEALDGRLVVATGHGRNGILHTPLSAVAAVAALIGQELPEAKACDPHRIPNFIL
ncbi:MAG: hypothetical protein DI579_04210 [Lawsonella clevelandensis]|uniref:FAD dependent oxidoreductase domain-containing protein n=1 Tax=Lawsonella clevelandensis TaxID=1528099 RepID=A0A2W5IAN9_9ACTN|nr:MAG: hypothetical protein DI579_04210 [Lawsonella clevelandensis]